MRRRTLLTAAAATLAMPAILRAASATTLKFIPSAELAVLDPVWTTSYQTRDHGFLVFDTLFGVDDAFRASPQMVDGVTTEPDEKTWRLTLRDGLTFHDGSRVLARDCVASVKRWGVRDSFGQALMAATDEIAAPDDRTIVFRLKRPFPLLPDALGKISPSMCPMMPERLAMTDPFKQVTEMIGSGPYRYVAAERVPGAKVVYQRFDGYRPRPDGTPSRTAGPKIPRMERIEWDIILDNATAAGALRRGEVDWWVGVDPDQQPMLARAPGVVVKVLEPTGLVATMRMNQLQPPFDNPKLRRAIIGGVQQSDYMQASMGTDRALWRDGVGYFPPGSPFASDAGMTALTAPRDLDAVKRAVGESGYKGERVVLLDGTDIASVAAMMAVTADMFHKIGLNVDLQAMDWGTVVQRRAKMDPVDQGGWSVYQTSWAGLDELNPAVNAFLRGNGKLAAPGWPTSPEIERLRDQWFVTDGLPAQQAITRQIQTQAFTDVPYIPLGQALPSSGYRADLVGLLPGQPVFWNVSRRA